MISIAQQRFYPNGEVMGQTGINIGVFSKSATSSLEQWVSTTLDVPGLQTIPKGNIVDALNEAYAELDKIYAEETTPGYDYSIHWPDQAVTYNEREQDGVTISQVGVITGDGGILSYMTFLAPNGGNYVYAVELYLYDYHGRDNVVPTDADYINIFNKMLSSIVFTR